MGVDRKERKKEAMANIAHVQEVLRRWDPIGVFPGPSEDQGPMDEYDFYAPRLLGLLQRGAEVEAVEARLVRIRTRWMGLDPYPPSDRPIAEELVAWWRSRARA
jgi:hypothetical protein